MKYLLFLLSCLLLVSSACADDADGYWEPRFGPGHDLARLPTLAEIEPRVAIRSLPFTIGAPGAYFLPCTLVATQTGDGIIIASDDVKLDLNGFGLNGAPVISDNGSGIKAIGVVHNVTIRNGTVRQWGKKGVDLSNAFESRIEQVTAFTNGTVGIHAGGNSYVVECGAFLNGNEGILAGANTSITDSKAADNQAGIRAPHSGIVSGCISANNRSHGIEAEPFSTVRNCTVTGNAADGIYVTDNCRIEDNNIGSNGGAGIRLAGMHSRIERNNLAHNGMGGIDLNQSSNPQHNFIVLNTITGATGPGFFITNNFAGELLTPETMGENMSNVSPWANFSF